MKKRFYTILTACILYFGLSVTGCGGTFYNGASSGSGASSESLAVPGSRTDKSESYDAGGLYSADQAAEEKIAEDADMDSGSESGLGTGTVTNQNQKMIYTYNYSTETKEFDSFYQKVTAKTQELGGYVESSETNGSVSDGINRYAHLTLRIPAEKMEQLTSLLDTESNVTYRSRSSENVTLQYVDMESHIKALRTEQKALLQLLEKAEKLKDIIALQSQLTQVRYEIESYESQLRMYDNLVDYSTIYLDITEVERTTNVTSAHASFFEETADRFSDNLYAVGQWLRMTAIWLISSLPVLLPLAAVLAAAFILIRKRTKGCGLRRKKFMHAKNARQNHENETVHYESIFNETIPDETVPDETVPDETDSE